MGNFGVGQILSEHGFRKPRLFASQFYTTIRFPRSMSSNDSSQPATRADVERLERQLAELRAAIERHDASLKMGLTRMGQLQADIDLIRAAWTKITPK
jgi:hypothetical protein